MTQATASAGEHGAAAPDQATPSTPAAPQPVVIPHQMACPICQAQFDPWATKGHCPVCNEAIVLEEQVTRKVPVLTSTWAWLKAGGWRLVLLTAFVLYELILFLYLWRQFSDAHLF